MESVSKRFEFSVLVDPTNSVFLLASIALIVSGLFGLNQLLLRDIAKDVSKHRPSSSASESLGSSSWRGRDKTRSATFVTRALYRHTVVKGKKVVHGLGGLISWSLSFILTVWFAVTLGAQRGPPILTKIMAAAVLMMNAGHFTPYFQKKLHRFGKFRLVFSYNSTLALGFAMGANSIYAQPTISDVKNDYFTQLCTYQSLILPMLSLYYFAQSMIQRANFIGKNAGITFSTCLGYFYAPFLYKVWYGEEALVELYSNNTHMSDVVYFLHVSGLLCQLSNNVFIVMTLSRVFTLEQAHRVVSKMCIYYGTFVIVILALVVSPAVAFVYTFMVGCVFPFHKVFPVHDLKENQKKLGIFVQENGGNSLGFGVEGTSKMDKTE